MDSNSHVPKIEQDIILREFYFTPNKLSTHMAKAEAIKKKVYAKSSCKHNRPICFDKPRLSYNDNVRYLLDHSELEGSLKYQQAIL
ncbi:hypothetical protein C1646_751630 [Rhizophagus diaphanus]|nr:hypothetical protein C1646_751630 [Rhizophagus diaphanus] [Rhizophagus sp. MUCL 43196]